jgi:hypothetical protein
MRYFVAMVSCAELEHFHGTRRVPDTGYGTRSVPTTLAEVRR